MNHKRSKREQKMGGWLGLKHMRHLRTHEDGVVRKLKGWGKLEKLRGADGLNHKRSKREQKMGGWLGLV